MFFIRIVPSALSAAYSDAYEAGVMENAEFYGSMMVYGEAGCVNDVKEIVDSLG